MSLPAQSRRRFVRRNRRFRNGSADKLSPSDIARPFAPDVVAVVRDALSRFANPSLIISMAVKNDLSESNIAVYCRLIDTTISL